MTGRPLTRERDAELAYLAQYEQHSPVVPFGARRRSYRTFPRAPAPSRRTSWTSCAAAYSYLAADAEQDGTGAQPTPLVPKAREARRSARRSARAGAQSEPGSIDIHNALVVGKYS
ncbi:hypothetical protein [Streptomyces sp. NPDC002994]|uniref:hypothetical protein n=1 Tax=Streptomyces sp. NPDC002994 TaxID=3154441 RepID=UPI0033BF8DDA